MMPLASIPFTVSHRGWPSANSHTTRLTAMAISSLSGMIRLAPSVRDTASSSPPNTSHWASSSVRPNRTPRHTNANPPASSAQRHSAGIFPPQPRHLPRENR